MSHNSANHPAHGPRHDVVSSRCWEYSWLSSACHLYQYALDEEGAELEQKTRNEISTWLHLMGHMFSTRPFVTDAADPWTAPGHAFSKARRWRAWTNSVRSVHAFRLNHFSKHTLDSHYQDFTTIGADAFRLMVHSMLSSLLITCINLQIGYKTRYLNGIDAWKMQENRLTFDEVLEMG